MKKIIVVSGKGDIGKTTLLKMVIEELKTKGTVLNYPSGNSKRDDKSITIKYDGLIVSITTVGDLESYIKKDYLTLQSFIECDVFICACRSWGETLKYLEKLAKDNKATLTILNKGDVPIYDGNESGQIVNKKREDLNIAQRDWIISSIQ